MKTLVKGDDDPILFTFITTMLRIFLLQLKDRNVLLIQRERSQKKGILILKQNIFMSHLQISEKIILREKNVRLKLNLKKILVKRMKNIKKV